MRQDKLLVKAIRLGEFPIQLGCVHKRIVGTQQNSSIRRRQRAESIDECVFERPSNLDRVVTLTDVEADAFAIGAVENCVEINQAVPTRPNVRRIGSPPNIRYTNDADARFDARRAAFLEPAMALPALDLHDSLHSFAIDGKILHTKTRPNYSIAEIRLRIDHMLNALCEHFVDNYRSCVALEIRRAARDVQKSTDSLTRSFAFGDHTLDV